MKDHRDTMKLCHEEGQTIIITALCVAVLCGFLALALDVGLMFNARHRVQTAADAAAIAGALTAAYSSDDATASARAAAGINGITDTTNQVAVNLKPTSGWHTGLSYVEVIITQPNPTVFMGMFGRHSMNVAARAVAGLIPGTACIYALDPSSPDTFVIKGTSNVEIQQCGAQVNSTGASYCDQGNGTLSAPYIHLVGTPDTNGGCKERHGPTITSGVTPVTNPLGNLNLIPSSACNGTNTVGTATVIATTPIPSSKYTAPDGSVSNLTCFPANTTLSNVTLGSTGGDGLYLFTNGVSMSNTIAVNGTLENYAGQFSQGNAQLTITAPINPVGSNLYTYNGLAFIQAPTAMTPSTPECSPPAGNAGVPCLQIQFGSGNENLSGMIYAPTSQVMMQDEGGGAQATGVIAYQIYINSDLKITSYNIANPNTSPLSTVTLVE